MSWGEPFRKAWNDATPGAQSAARESVRGVERAAASLSDSLLHALQLMQFAAQDLEGLRAAVARAPTGARSPDMTPLKRAMDEIRQGRIPPDKAEKHLRQALQSVSQQARSVAGSVGAATSAAASADEAQGAALRRLCELRRAVGLQCAEMRGRPGQQPAGDVPGATRLAHVARLAQAFRTLDGLFLATKRVDDPAVPLPAASSREEANDA